MFNSSHIKPKFWDLTHWPLRDVQLIHNLTFPINFIYWYLENFLWNWSQFSATKSHCWCVNIYSVNSLRPRQNGCHFPDNVYKWIFLNENVWISLKISLTFVPKVPINDIPALVQIMAWRRTGVKPLSEPIESVKTTSI